MNSIAYIRWSYKTNDIPNMKKLTVNTVKLTQLAIPEIGQDEKEKYKLVIGEIEQKDKSLVIDIGKSTFDKVNELLKQAIENENKKK